MGIISAVLNHSGKIPSDNKLLKSIEIAGEIRGDKILCINSGIFMRSVDLFFCLRIRFISSSLSRGWQKNKFYMCASKFNGKLFE